MALDHAPRVATNPHDQLVRKTLGIPEHAAGELRAILPPALAKRVDWSTLRAEPGSFVDTGGPERHTDLLFSATIGGRDARIYVVFEHQSSFDRWMPLRLLVYMGRIWVSLADAGAKRLPVIVPVVLYNGDTTWTGARRFADLLDADEPLLTLTRAFIPNFQLLIDDLARVSELALLRRPMSALARLVVWVLRAVRLGFDPAHLAEWARLLEQARLEAGPEAFTQLFVYLSEVDGGDTLYGAIEAIIDDELSEETMGLRKKWEDAAREQGIKQGIEQGIDRGRAELLLKQLQLKFGDIGEARREQVGRASREELERWAQRVLSATSLDEVLD